MTKIPSQAHEFQHAGFLDVGIHAWIRLLGNSSLHDRRHYEALHLAFVASMAAAKKRKLLKWLPARVPEPLVLSSTSTIENCSH